MGKWLIRTQKNQILGPVSREKVTELLENHSLQNRDEVCSGNGYWFFVEEKDLVEKYLYQGMKQNFEVIADEQEDSQTGIITLNDLIKGQELEEPGNLNQKDEVELTSSKIPEDPLSDIEAPEEVRVKPKKKENSVENEMSSGEMTEIKTRRLKSPMVFALVFMIVAIFIAYFFRSDVFEFKNDLQFFEKESVFSRPRIMNEAKAQDIQISEDESSKISTTNPPKLVVPISFDRLELKKKGLTGI